MMTGFVMSSALAGVLLLAAVLLIAQAQGRVFRAPYLMLTLSPSSIMLMPLEAVEKKWWDPILVYGISTGVNVLLYSAVGIVLWSLWSLHDRYLK